MTIVPNSETQYSFDQGGNLIPVRKHGPLRGSFRGFYADRSELTGTTPYGYDWLNAARPTVERWNGNTPRKRTKGAEAAESEPRDWGPPQEQDISGFSSDPRPYKPMGTSEFDGVGSEMGASMEGFGGHRLTNVRVGQMAGEEIGGSFPALGVPKVDFSPQAYPGHRLTNVRFGQMAGEEIGGQPGLHAGPTGIGTQGAMPRGSQFGSVGAAPRPFGELPAAGGSSYTYTTTPKGQMGWDF
jgi:hypothetical protein